MKSLDFADIRSILFVNLCECKSDTPILNLRLRTCHRMVDLGLELCLRFALTE